MARKTPRGDEGLICPLHKQDCSEVCHKCPWWTQVRGKSPQSGEEIDDWQCAISIMPMLSIETSRNVRGNQAATESMRNEIVKRMDRPAPQPYVQNGHIAQGPQQHLIGSDDDG